MAEIVIIGNGIAGVTCARHARKRSDDRITIVSGETDHFFSRTALMYIYMGHMQYAHTKPYEDWFWEKNNIELKRAWVDRIDTDAKQLQLRDGSAMRYDKLVIATGSKPNKFGWKGQDLKGVQGLYSYHDLELLEQNTHPPKSSNPSVKHAVLVGGGLIGVELAEMLQTRNIDVSFLVRESRFWGNVLPADEAQLIEHHMQHDHHIDLRLNSELDEIIDDGTGRVAAVRTKDGTEIECQFVGLTAGVSPNIEFVRSSKVAVDRGVLVNRFLETNIADVYAIGDCTQMDDPPKNARKFNQVWYTGKMMGETLAQTLVGNKTAYLPGPWFNSAKFFDIEYQTYGTVVPQPSQEVASFYWENREKRLAVKLQFERESGLFLGINTFGIRLRHEPFDAWLKQGETVGHVLSSWKKVWFDPEFYKDYHGAIITAFNADFPAFAVAKPSKKFFWT